MTQVVKSVPRRKEGANTVECGGTCRINVLQFENIRGTEWIRAAVMKSTGKLEVSLQKCGEKKRGKPPKKVGEGGKMSPERGGGEYGRGGGKYVDLPWWSLSPFDSFRMTPILPKHCSLHSANFPVTFSTSAVFTPVYAPSTRIPLLVTQRFCAAGENFGGILALGRK